MKLAADCQKLHPNKIWSKLKKKYNFYSYRYLETPKYHKIREELNHSFINCDTGKHIITTR
nr:MAG TPA: hypothetical protein [Caudoviricetes sp.]